MTHFTTLTHGRRRPHAPTLAACLGLTLMLMIAACTQYPETAVSEPTDTAGNDAAPEQSPRIGTVRQKVRPHAAQLATAGELSRNVAPVYRDQWHNITPVKRERYANYGANPVKQASAEPVSTFSIDVDTGSYSNVRRLLNAGQLPPRDAVRVEELLNYFSYDYPQPDSANTPFSINMAMTRTPWNKDTHLLQIGLQGYAIAADKRPATNLVFLIDVSGSMQSPDKLPLLKNAFRLLTGQLDGDDSIAVVVYAGSSGIVLEPTAGDQRAKILAALDQLEAGGSTNGSAGIEQAYQLAQQGYIAGGINRVILATDGDFNVGLANVDALVDRVAHQRESGISLTTLGFGTGNYNDTLMEQLADAGNGNYAYIDNLLEARKVLVEELGATLQTIAKDVKVQVEFNPALVAEYRLIGYENRLLEREEFNNDQVDAGEIGAGHTVTALYEVTLTSSRARSIDPLRYGSGTPKDLADNATASNADARELAFVRLRHKAPNGVISKLTEQAVTLDDIVSLQAASSELRFAAAVAAFGQRLQGGKYLQSFDYPQIRQLAANARGADSYGYRGEFMGLVDLAASLAPITPDHSAANQAAHQQERGRLVP